MTYLAETDADWYFCQFSGSRVCCRLAFTAEVAPQIDNSVRMKCAMHRSCEYPFRDFGGQPMQFPHE